MAQRRLCGIGLSFLVTGFAVDIAAANPLDSLNSEDRSVIQLLLEHQPSNAPRPLPSGGTLTITRTETSPRICRWFTLSGPSGSGSGMGCREGPREWSLSGGSGAAASPAPAVQPPVPAAPPAAPPQPAPVPSVAVAPAPTQPATLPTVIRPQAAAPSPTTPLPVEGSGASAEPLALAPQLRPRIISTQPPRVEEAPAPQEVAALPREPAPSADIAGIPTPPSPPPRRTGATAAGVQPPPMEPPRPDRRPVAIMQVADGEASAPSIVPPPLPARRPGEDLPHAAAQVVDPVEIAEGPADDAADAQADAEPVLLDPVPDLPLPPQHPRNVTVAEADGGPGEVDWRAEMTRLDPPPEAPLPAPLPAGRSTAPAAVSVAELNVEATAEPVSGRSVVSGALSFPGAPAATDQGSAEDRATDEGAQDQPEEVVQFLTPRPDVPLPGRRPGEGGDTEIERLDPAPEIPLPPRRPTEAG